MKRVLSLIFYVVLSCVMLQGCEITDTGLKPKIQVTSYYEKSVEINQALTLYIDCDYVNVEFYSWDKNSVSFEVTKHIRGSGTSAKLENELKKLDVTTKQDGPTVTFESRYHGSIKSPADKGIDAKIYLPARIASLSYKIDTGSVKFLDDITCDFLKAEVNAVNTEIKNFKGKITFTGDVANLRIENGRLSSGSNVKTNIGNIYINASYEEGSDYSYGTSIGIIELLTPASAKISFSTIGSVETNDFISASYPTTVNVKSDMGKITIRKTG